MAIDRSGVAEIDRRRIARAAQDIGGIARRSESLVTLRDTVVEGTVEDDSTSTALRRASPEPLRSSPAATAIDRCARLLTSRSSFCTSSSSFATFAVTSEALAPRPAQHERRQATAARRQAIERSPVFWRQPLP